MRDLVIKFINASFMQFSLRCFRTICALFGRFVDGYRNIFPNKYSIRLVAISRSQLLKPSSWHVCSNQSKISNRIIYPEKVENIKKLPWSIGESEMSRKFGRFSTRF